MIVKNGINIKKYRDNNENECKNRIIKLNNTLRELRSKVNELKCELKHVKLENYNKLKEIGLINEKNEDNKNGWCLIF